MGCEDDDLKKIFVAGFKPFAEAEQLPANGANASDQDRDFMTKGES